MFFLFDTYTKKKKSRSIGLGLWRIALACTSTDFMFYCYSKYTEDNLHLNWCFYIMQDILGNLNMQRSPMVFFFM